MNKIAFLDRDGVLNVDKGYVFQPKELELVEGVIEGLQLLSRRGFKLVIVTNQSGIGRGLFSFSDFSKCMYYLRKLFEQNSIYFSNILYCPHHPDDSCCCRKPKTGMLRNFGAFDTQESIMVGDKRSDYEFAKNVNIRKFFHLNDKPLAEMWRGDDYIHLSDWHKIKNWY